MLFSKLDNKLISLVNYHLKFTNFYLNMLIVRQTFLKFDCEMLKEIKWIRGYNVQKQCVLQYMQRIR